MMNTSKIAFREIQPHELSRLEDFLYEAIYQPDKDNQLPREVIKAPKISVYIDNFGKQNNDYCLIADLEGNLIGAVWVRILAGEIKGYGNIDAQTPEFAISLLKEYRNQGIGTLLMLKMIDYLKNKGYAQCSLSVQKANYAAKIYQKLGFEIVKERDEEYLMLLKLR